MSPSGSDLVICTPSLSRDAHCWHIGSAIIYVFLILLWLMAHNSDAASVTLSGMHHAAHTERNDMSRPDPDSRLTPSPHSFIVSSRWSYQSSPNKLVIFIILWFDWKPSQVCRCILSPPELVPPPTSLLHHVCIIIVRQPKGDFTAHSMPWLRRADRHLDCSW